MKAGCNILSKILMMLTEEIMDINGSGWGAAQANGINYVLRDRSPKVNIDGSKVGTHICCLADADDSDWFGKSQE